MVKELTVCSNRGVQGCSACSPWATRSSGGVPERAVCIWQDDTREYQSVVNLKHRFPPVLSVIHTKIHKLSTNYDLLCLFPTKTSSILSQGILPDSSKSYP